MTVRRLRCLVKKGAVNASAAVSPGLLGFAQLASLCHRSTDAQSPQCQHRLDIPQHHSIWQQYIPASAYAYPYVKSYGMKKS